MRQSVEDWFAAHRPALAVIDSNTRPNDLIACLGVLQSSTYVLLLAIGYRSGAGAPIFAEKPVGTPAVDPVVQALALTDIVVGAAVTALLLCLVVQLQKCRGTIEPDELSPSRD